MTRNLLLSCEARPVIAHRGASAYAPENTLPAFQLAREHAVDGCEFDVRVSADGVPVVVHDPTLQRTTNLRGRVADQPFAALREGDAGYRFTRDAGRTFPFRGQGIRIPTLEEVLDTLGDLPLIIELKTAAAMHPVARVLRERAIAERCIVASFDYRALDVFRESPFIAGASRLDLLHIVVRSRLGLSPLRLPYKALAIPRRRKGIPVFSAALARMARKLDCPVHVWTVDDPREAIRLWKAGATGIITNAPDIIRRARTEAGFASG